MHGTPLSRAHGRSCPRSRCAGTWTLKNWLSGDRSAGRGTYWRARLLLGWHNSSCRPHWRLVHRTWSRLRHDHSWRRHLRTRSNWGSRANRGGLLSCGRRYGRRALNRRSSWPRTHRRNGDWPHLNRLGLWLFRRWRRRNCECASYSSIRNDEPRGSGRHSRRNHSGRLSRRRRGRSRPHFSWRIHRRNRLGCGRRRWWRLLPADDGFKYVAGPRNLGQINFGFYFITRRAGWARRFCGRRRVRPRAKMRSHFSRFILFERAGMRFLLGDANFLKHIENSFALNFKLSRQIVDSNLAHPPFRPQTAVNASLLAGGLLLNFFIIGAVPSFRLLNVPGLLSFCFT